MLTRLVLKQLKRDVFSLVRERRLPDGLLTGDYNSGYCPICQARTLFIIKDSWLRDHYFCIRCASIPRWRALIYVLQSYFPDWRNLHIHESSPGGASSDKLRRECGNYIATHFFPDTPVGEMKYGFRCENLERQTFQDEQFDLVVTQDVFEHILNPALALKEVCRTLKPGGAHLFTIPWYYWKKTLVRATESNGSIRHLEEPDYHGNPIDASGSLVVTEWGWDFCDFIYEQSGMTTTVIRITNRRMGIDGKFIEVFISRKAIE